MEQLSDRELSLSQSKEQQCCRCTNSERSQAVTRESGNISEMVRDRRIVTRDPNTMCHPWKLNG